MTTSEQLIHLAQNDQIRNFLRDYSPLELITVYAAPEAEDPTDDGLVVFPALIPANRVQSVLNNSNWVLRVGGGLPYFEDADPTAGIEPNYFPHINHDGVEALVHVRSFLGARAGYVEISEEFRLFHNLYHDDLSGKFLKFDEAGLEEIVATATDNSECVRIRLKELRQFLAAKQMHLVLQHESTVRSTKDLSELGIQLGNSGLEKSSNACWSLAYGPSHAGDESMASLSRLHCNRIVAPFDLADGRIPGYGSALLPRFEEFAIDTDELGDQIRHTCDPQTLKANAIDRPQAPTFLTPVAFRKSVLDRYYENPSKYSIKSGHLACGGFWSIRIDNHHEDKVVAWLGDLGQSLPHTEQLHWRAHNFVDPGGVSEVNYRRQNPRRMGFE